LIHREVEGRRTGKRTITKNIFFFLSGEKKKRINLIIFFILDITIVSFT